MADEFGIKNTYTSYEEMLKNEDINTVDITTPTLLHAPMSIAAIRAGKNVLFARSRSALPLKRDRQSARKPKNAASL